MINEGGRVVVVDDEPAVRQLAGRILGRRGFDVVEAGDGATALEMAAGADVRLLLTDVVLPGMDGRELAEKLRERCPDLAVIFMSGYEEDEIAGMGITGVGASYITKPFTADVLTLMVEGALDVPASNGNAMG